MALGDIAAFDVQSLTTLTSAGVTSGVEVYATALTFQVTVSNIGTNVVIRFEGSLDDVSYYNLAASEANYTITANGTYGYVLAAPLRYIRLRLVSISGGTPTVSCKAGAL
jgi:hypothetical protein